MATRILCIGVDPLLIETRCAVLRYVGYEALSAMPYDADEILQATQFDLVILSAFLTEEDKVRLTRLVGDEAKVLRLETLVQVDELLQKVKKRIAAPSVS